MRAFDKPALTVAQQLQLLKERGLTVQDDERASRFLEVVSLFRLSPYMRPFQHAGNPDHRFHPGASLRQIVTIYRFDTDLRSLVMKAIERVEVATRACISNHMAPEYGAHWYLDQNNFKRQYDHARLITELTTKRDEEVRHFQRERSHIQQGRADEATQARRIEHRKRDNYLRFYALTYSQPELPPSWAMLEELSLGALSRIYGGIARDVDRKQIAHRFNLPQEVLGSWLHTLTFIRNICAHHARLWNRELAVRPQLPQQANWQLPRAAAQQPHPDKRLFVVLLMLAYMMGQISPDSHWKQQMVALLAEHPAINMTDMGFVANWQQHPVWQGIEE